MVVSAADRFVVERKKFKTWSDFLTDFDKNPQTGFLAMVTNEDSVKQSIHNLVLTQRTERFYRPAIRSKTFSLLFEPVDEVTTMNIRNAINETLRYNEPRAIIREVQVIPKEDLYMYVVNVVFSIVNIPDQTFDLSVILQRVR